MAKKKAVLIDPSTLVTPAEYAKSKNKTSAWAYQQIEKKLVETVDIGGKTFIQQVWEK